MFLFVNQLLKFWFTTNLVLNIDKKIYWHPVKKLSIIPENPFSNIKIKTLGE